jgi:hypothetical protein
MATAEQLERRADRARERLAGRLNELQYHTSPALVAKDLLGADVPRTAGDIFAVLSRQVRTNPLAFMLIATGVGWLIYSDAQARSHARARPANAARRRTRKPSTRRPRTRSK